MQQNMVDKNMCTETGKKQKNLFFFFFLFSNFAFRAQSKLCFLIP